MEVKITPPQKKNVKIYALSQHPATRNKCVALGDIHHLGMHSKSILWLELHSLHGGQKSCIRAWTSCQTASQQTLETGLYIQECGALLRMLMPTFRDKVMNRIWNREVIQSFGNLHAHPSCHG